MELDLNLGPWVIWWPDCIGLHLIRKVKSEMMDREEGGQDDERGEEAE